MTLTDDDLDRRLQKWGADARVGAPEVELPDFGRDSRPRRRLVAVLASAAAVAAVSIALAVALGHGSHGTPADRPTSPVTGDPLPPTSTQHEWRYRGLAVNVPRSWPANDLRCGSPRRDTVIIDLGAVGTCAARVPRGVSWVEFAPAPSLSHALVYAGSPAGATSHLVHVEGATAERVTGVTDLAGHAGRHVVALFVPSLDVVLVAASPSAAEARRLAATAHLVPVTGKGVLRGRLEAVGGPANAPADPQPGVVTVRRKGASNDTAPVATMRVGADGRFRFRLRPGPYDLEGSTPRYIDNGKRGACSGYATVTDDGVTHADVICDRR